MGSNGCISITVFKLTEEVQSMMDFFGFLVIHDLCYSNYQKVKSNEEIMLKDDLKQTLTTINATLDTKQLNAILKPVLELGMQRGYKAAYLLIVGLSEGVQAENQPATWIDNVEHAASDDFKRLLATEQHKELNVQINSMLAEEYHAVTDHHNNQLVVESVVMPYFNGWFLGYYYAFLNLISEVQAAKDAEKEIIKKQISDQAMQAVESERSKFQRQMFYQNGVLRDILSAL